MKELFFSLISRRIFITLLENGKVVKTIHEDNYHKHSENFVLKVREIFDELPFPINDIDRIFFLTGPGGQTGERISFSFALGSLLSNSVIKAFSMDSLAFQAATSRECLSVISTGEKSKSYHLAVYQNEKLFFKKEKIGEEEFREVKRMFPNLPVEINFEKTDFLRSFLICKGKFKAFEDGVIQS